MAVHAIDRHDVGVAHPGHRPRFTEQRVGFGVSIETAGQKELQSDVTLECRVERSVDLAERASPHPLQALERPPTLQRLWSRAIGKRNGFELGFVQSSLPVFYRIVQV